MYLAVYGSLRRGAQSDGLLKDFEYIGEDKVHGKLYKCGWFPGVVLGGDSEVVVEVFKGDDFAVIDIYEGCHDNSEESLFLRVPATTISGKTCVIYVPNFDVHPEDIIPSGDWLNDS